MNNTSYTFVERSHNLSNATWIKNSIYLSANTGKTVEIAFQVFSVNKDYLAIDVVALVATCDIAAALIPQSETLEQNDPNHSTPKPPSFLN